MTRAEMYQSLKVPVTRKGDDPSKRPCNGCGAAIGERCAPITIALGQKLGPMFCAERVRVPRS